MEFDSLDEAYKHLETQSQDYKYRHQIGQLFIPIRDKAHLSHDTDTVKKAQWEIDAFNFVLDVDQAKPMSIMRDENGKEIRIPDFDSLEAEAFEYYKERINQTQSPVLEARYAHLCWLSPNKDHKLALKAIESYLTLARSLEEKDTDNPEEHFGLDVLKQIEFAFKLSKQLKHDLTTVKAEILRVVSSYPDTGSKQKLIHDLANLMLVERRVFSENDFRGVPEVCISLAEKVLAERNWHFAIELFSLADKCNERCPTLGSDQRRRAAEVWVQAMNDAEKSTNLASHSFCLNAVKAYKQLGDHEKVHELMQKYSTLKENAEYQSIEVEIDMTEPTKRFQAAADKLSNLPSERLIAWIIGAGENLPTIKLVDENTKAFTSGQVLTAFIPQQVVDSNGNVSAHYVTDEEKNKFNRIQSYDRLFRIFFIRLNDMVLSKCIESGNYNFDAITSYLKEHSWIGKAISKKVGKDSEHLYSWLELIEPALKVYFDELNKMNLDSEYSGNFILVIDSLATKVEGILRDFLKLKGEPTTTQTRDHAGREITRERLIQDILRDDMIRNEFPEETILFLKYLLVEPAGLNLRHDVAHALLLPQGYGVLLAHMLVIAILKIGIHNINS